MIRHIKILGVLGFFFLGATAYGGETAAGGTDLPGSGNYSLVKKIATHGESAITQKGESKKLGVWGEDRFLFPGGHQTSEVVLASDVFEDRPVEIIQLQIQSEETRTLDFHKIEAKPRLQLFFKMLPQESADLSPSSIYVNIYLGKKRLDRFRLSPDSEWTRKVYSLSSAQFLKQKLKLKLILKTDTDGSVLKLFGHFSS